MKYELCYFIKFNTIYKSPFYYVLKNKYIVYDQDSDLYNTIEHIYNSYEEAKEALANMCKTGD